MLRQLAVLISLAIPFSAYAEDKNGISFFGGTDLDYWNQGPRPMKPPLLPSEKSREPAKPFQNKGNIRVHDAEPFSWTDYEDPKNEVFWDDGGDYIPPRPFREVAMNPTPDNIARYLNWTSAKLALSNRLQNVLEQKGEGTERPTQTAKSRPDFDWRRVSVVYFYQSRCGHCQKSAPVVTELESVGAHVIPVQLDWKDAEPLHPNSTRYEGELARQYRITATPTWMVSVGGKRIVLTKSFLSLGELARAVISREGTEENETAQ